MFEWMNDRFALELELKLEPGFSPINRDSPGRLALELRPAFMLFTSQLFLKLTAIQ